MHNHSPLQPALPEPLAALLAPLGRDVIWRVGRAAHRQASVRAGAVPFAVAHARCQAQEDAGRADDLAILEDELAGLLAARELLMAWAERMAQEGRSGLNPAQLLRAWGDSTGRVIQLLKARRELCGAGETDALLDAVYAELEAELLRTPELDAIEEELP
jgi:hypothetical protein